MPILPATCAVERIEIVVGIIRSEGERHLVLEHRMPRIGAREPARPQSRLGHRPIRQRMDRLHRGDDAALAEAREIGGGDALLVLKPPARSVERLVGNRRVRSCYTWGEPYHLVKKK